jgi:uncharacterized protein YegL
MKLTQQVFNNAKPDVVNKTKQINAFVLLFTDGAPSAGDFQKALDISYLLRKQGVQVFCISTPDGDKPYLVGITGKEDRVISATDDKIEEAFSQAESMMKDSMIGSGSASTTMSFVRVSGWCVSMYWYCISFGKFTKLFCSKRQN